MQGKRVLYPGPDTLEHHQPGNYWKNDVGNWYGITPNGYYCGLENHHVEEHEDGTITVVSGPWGSNSILVGDNVANGRICGNVWHGYIKHGVWEEC